MLKQISETRSNGEGTQEKDQVLALVIKARQKEKGTPSMTMGAWFDTFIKKREYWEKAMPVEAFYIERNYKQALDVRREE